MQSDRRRMTAMHRAKMAPGRARKIESKQFSSRVCLGPSPLSTQNPEPTPTQYHPSMESASPSSSGKMMPVGGKGGKPAAMSALARSNLSQQVPSAQHSPYYNGGKGNPTGPGGYSMMMNPQSQQWLAQQQSQQQQRYAAHMASGGKPMAYGQQRMSYGGDAYMMRQTAPQMSSSSYPYGSNLGKSSTIDHRWRWSWRVCL